MSYTPDVYGEWIRAVLEDAIKPLTTWEESFVESISDQFDRTGRLSERQVEILGRIYTEKTA